MNDLIVQYNNLSDEKKKALLVYKSKLSFCINEISAIENFESLEPIIILDKIKSKDRFIDIYEDYKELLSNPANILMKMTVYSKVDFENEIKFIESLRNIYFELTNESEILYTTQNLKVYRAITINNEESFIAKGNLISTTLDIETCEEFITFGNKTIIYEIELPIGSPVLICPYEIKSDYTLDSYTSKITNIPTQHEIILKKNDFNFEITSETEIDGIIIKKIKAIQKTKVDKR